MLPGGCEGGSWTGDRIYIPGSACLCALHSGSESNISVAEGLCQFELGRGKRHHHPFGWVCVPVVGQWAPRGGNMGLWGSGVLPSVTQCWGAHPAPTIPVGFQAGCKEGTFHLSLVMPSVAWQS